MVTVIVMLYTYIDLKKKGYSAYQIEKLVNEKRLYKIEKGLYGTSDNESDLEIIRTLYPDSIITLESAFYYYGMLNKKPNFFRLATVQKARKIKRENVKQIFMTDKFYNLGISNMKYQNVHVVTYDLERLLIEIVRNKVKIDYDTYNEVIKNYQRIAKLLNKKKLSLYLPYFKDPKIIERIKNEVYLEKKEDY